MHHSFTLSHILRSATKDNEEKYSRFLYKLDKTGGITETKKKQFIGIYQMMNIFTRDAGVCAGALMKQGKEITMGNLISAYTSRKHSGKADRFPYACVDRSTSITALVKERAVSGGSAGT